METDRTVRAQAAIMERHANPCPECEGSTMVEDDGGFAMTCPKCNGTGVAA